MSKPVQREVSTLGLSAVGTGSGVRLVIDSPLCEIPTGPICTLPFTTMIPCFSLITIRASVWISEGSIGMVISVAMNCAGRARSACGRRILMFLASSTPAISA